MTPGAGERAATLRDEHTCPDCGAETEGADCDDCGGSGIADADSREPCELCGGSGVWWYFPECVEQAQREERLHNLAMAAVREDR